MEIQEEHRHLLLKLGLKERDFKLFDGRHVTYEFQEGKGVRLYDPYYQTSYEEYIGLDGWSAWSSEEDRFISRVVTAARRKVEAEEKTKTGREELVKALEKKFSKKER